MYKLEAFLPAVVEPDPNAPPPVTPYVGFASPPNFPGGIAHLSLDPTVEPKPSELTAVYIPTGAIAEADLAAANLIGNSAYPQGAVAVTDATLTTLSVTVLPPPSPGTWDIAVFGTYPDPAPAA